MFQLSTVPLLCFFNGMYFKHSLQTTRNPSEEKPKTANSIVLVLVNLCLDHMRRRCLHIFLHHPPVLVADVALFHALLFLLQLTQKHLTSPSFTKLPPNLSSDSCYFVPRSFVCLLQQTSYSHIGISWQYVFDFFRGYLINLSQRIPKVIDLTEAQNSHFVLQRLGIHEPPICPTLVVRIRHKVLLRRIRSVCAAMRSWIFGNADHVAMSQTVSSRFHHAVKRVAYSKVY